MESRSSQAQHFAQAREQLQPQQTSVQAYFHQARYFLREWTSGSRREAYINESASSSNTPPYCDQLLLEMESTGLSSAEESDSYEKNTISNDYSEFSPYVSDGQMTFCSPDPDDFFALDGTADRITRRKKPPVAAIFIHAGAGYHSTANERIHLEACSEAARVSMKLLKGGRSAIEAVEAAIKVLEDKEITNAGYGSNLAIDGTVECDATLVDHLGRSGACGAVPNIKNPISLAKVILESSSKPLSLRRVPPNLLIGDGAKEYAWESGMTLVPNEWLVSKNARDRYIRWQEDLKRAEGKESSSPLLANYDRASNSDIDNEARRDHANAILTGTWNEGQPDSPANGSLWDAESPMNTPQKPRSPMSTGAITPQASPKTGMERSPLSFLGSSISSTKGVSAKLSSPATKRQRFVSPSSNESHGSGAVASGVNAAPYLAPHDGAGADESGMLTSLSNIGPPLAPASSMDPMGFDDGDEDRITDTVGAIAIDQSGYIAAGSSSGGIGMKHRGRIGPAALVGIGTAVIPAVEEDKDGIAVAAVTSGTGEHMATTVASQKCAERIYHGTRRGSGGQDIVDDDESAILESFILNDFQEHPGVKYSSSAGAIGVMAVKKSPVGYYLYFAHNTDSFALASMGSNDRDPACVMSRVSDGGNGIAQGARKIHIL